MQVILSTRNPSKIEQIRAIFDKSRIEILSLDDAGIPGDAIEDGRSLSENALIKARFAHKLSSEKLHCMADDTGLFIRSLGGAPGIHAARWAGEQATTDEITQFTLDKLKGVKDRSALFRTVVAIVSPDGSEQVFSGQVNGVILDKPRVRPQPKMPYSGIFVCEGTGLVWAQMSLEQENQISHRGQAFRLAKNFLENL